MMAIAVKSSDVEDKYLLFQGKDFNLSCMYPDNEFNNFSSCFKLFLILISHTDTILQTHGHNCHMFVIIKDNNHWKKVLRGQYITLMRFMRTALRLGHLWCITTAQIVFKNIFICPWHWNIYHFPMVTFVNTTWLLYMYLIFFLI